ncbi:MAG TPA: hypothetical protein VIG82_08930, partial [Enteractinococcus sp.]
ALRDAVKFAIARLEETELPGTNGRHTQLVVLADYPTLLQHVQDQLAYLFPSLVPNDERSCFASLPMPIRPTQISMPKLAPQIRLPLTRITI